MSLPICYSFSQQDSTCTEAKNADQGGCLSSPVKGQCSQEKCGLATELGRPSLRKLFSISRPKALGPPFAPTQSAATLRSESEIRGTLRFLPPLEMRPSYNAPSPVGSREETTRQFHDYLMTRVESKVSTNAEKTDMSV